MNIAGLIDREAIIHRIVVTELLLLIGCNSAHVWGDKGHEAETTAQTNQKQLEYWQRATRHTRNYLAQIATAFILSMRIMQRRQKSRQGNSLRKPACAWPSCWGNRCQLPSNNKHYHLLNFQANLQSTSIIQSCTAIGEIAVQPSSQEPVVRREW